MNEIKVQVVKYPDRKADGAAVQVPVDREVKTKSAKTSQQARRRESGRQVGSTSCVTGGITRRREMTWAEFRERYEKEVLAESGRTDGNEKVSYVFDSVEANLDPQLLATMTSEHGSALIRRTPRGRQGARAPSKSNLAHLKAALRWAERVGLAASKHRGSTCRSGPRPTAMKGRPITGEEFDRMLAKVAKVVGDEAADIVDALPHGLWLSGLRLAESLELFWDRDDKLCVDLDGQAPHAADPGGAREGTTRTGCWPSRPEFAEFLLTTPEGERTGPRVQSPATA